MGKIVIVAGGECDLTPFADILKDAYIIGADRGCLFLTDSGYRIDMAVGDFDSVTASEYGRIIGNAAASEKLPCEKNDTDLEHAVRLAADMEGVIHIFGATGTRLDQTLSAVGLLKILYDRGREAYIHDKNNRIRLAGGTVHLKKGGYRYISLIPSGDDPVLVSVKGLKYSGSGIMLDRTTSLGISNEFAGDEAEIVSSGCIYIVESGD